MKPGLRIPLGRFCNHQSGSHNAPQPKFGWEGFSGTTKYLICLKKSINEAYIFYKKTKNENIKLFKPTSINSRILYYQLCVKMFFELKSDYNMIEMQEEKTRALIFLYKNKDNDLVKIDATILRDMLANKNEIKWFRKVENEFNLTPLPKQSGE